MRIVTAVLVATLLLAGCTGSSNDSSGPEPTASPSDVSRSFDEDALRQQTEQQAEQKKAAEEDLKKQVGEQAQQLAKGTVVEIVIKNGKVAPQGERIDVRRGKPVTLVITSDVAEQIHVHSDPEHTYDVVAGEPVTESFTIDRPGQVAVEAHELGVTVVQLVVR